MSIRARYSRFLLGAVAGGPALLASGVALAQQTEGTGSEILTEVVVTAQFREENLQETPIAITAITSDLLEARSQTSIEQVAAQAPSVHLGPMGQANGSGLIAFIRGVGQTDFNFAMEPGVGLYIDDVYYPTLTGSLVDLLDIERVEILRGPQGTLAGRNSIGGAIKMYSKKPTGEGGSVSLTYGRFDRTDVRAMADFALVPDKLYTRIARVTKSRDGYVKRVDYACTHPDSGLPSFNVGMGCDLGTLGGISYTAGRVSLRWIASDSVEVNLIGDITNDSSEAGADVLRRANIGDGDPSPAADGVTSWLIALDDGDPSTPIVPYDCRFVPYGPHSCDPNGRNPYLSYATFIDPGLITNPGSPLPFKPIAVPPIQQLDQYGLSATIDWQISDNFFLKSITAWREYDSTWAQDVDGSPLPSQQLLQTLVHRQWSQEFRLNGRMGDRFDYTLGAFYFDQDGTLEARVDLNYAHIDFIHGPDTTPSTSKAVFLHGIYRLTDAMDLSAGVRYSEDEKTYTYFRRNPDGSLPVCNLPFTTGPFGEDQPTNCALNGLFDISDTFQGDRVDWRVALNYNFTADLMTYAQVSTGYKGGGVNPRPFFGPSTGPLNQLKAFEPETLTTYEVGIKTDTFNNRMRLNTALFYNEYEDIILISTFCPIAPCLQPNNVGEAVVRGVEVETEIHPTDHLSFDGSVSYLDFNYKASTAQFTPITNVSPDMVTPFTPEWKASLGVQYSRPIGDLGTFTARLDGSYTSEVYGLAVNAPTNLIPSYTLWNARLSWRSPDDVWDAALEVTNLSDKIYYTFVFDQAGSSGTTTYTPGLPRAWAITLRRSF